MGESCTSYRCTKHFDDIRVSFAVRWSASHRTHTHLYHRTSVVIRHGDLLASHQRPGHSLILWLLKIQALSRLVKFDATRFTSEKYDDRSRRRITITADPRLPCRTYSQCLGPILLASMNLLYAPIVGSEGAIVRLYLRFLRPRTLSVRGPRKHTGQETSSQGYGHLQVSSSV